MKAIKSINRSTTSAKLGALPQPLPVRRALVEFGHDLALARRRRRYSQVSMAERVGISVATLRRLEKGDGTVAWGTVVRAMQVMGELTRITTLLDTGEDELGLALMDQQLPQRIRSKKTGPESGGL
jgi:transcriptional regulator with XRE-family HTH domain